MKSPALTSLLVIGFVFFSLVAPGTSRVTTLNPVPQSCEQSRLRAIAVSVQDKEGQFVENLQVTDLALTEAKTAGEILKVEPMTSQPLSIVILLDASPSQAGVMPVTKLAARKFVEWTVRSNNDRAALVSFTEAATIEEEMTNDLNRLQEAISRLHVVRPPGYLAGRVITEGTPPGRTPKQGTAIWDAVWASSARLLQSSGQSRRAILLLTDGIDTASTRKMRDAINQAASDEVAVFLIGVKDSYDFLVRDRVKLEELSYETGGRAFFPKKARDFPDVLQKTAQQLRSHYLVTYCSTNQKTPDARVKIKIEFKNPVLRKADLRLSYRRYAL